jgi:two-component system, LytTR family, sensor kinase
MGRFDRRLVRYGTYVLIWTIFGVFFFTQDLSRKIFWSDPTPWWHYLVSWLVGVWLIAALTPSILWLGRRWPIERRRWPSRLALHGACSVGFAIVQVVVISALAPYIGFVGPLTSRSFLEILPVLGVISLHNNIVSYWTIIGAQHGFGYYRRYQERAQQALRLELHASELETQLVRARLGALKMQLQPHFLFNTMNAIMVLVRQQRGPEAEETIARLSDLLRFVLDDALAQEVPLRRELEYLGLYLSIEQLRFADRLRVVIEADPAILEAAVPHMGLQPIVENAVRHGTSQREAGGTIRLTARRVAETLVIEVTDDGPGLVPAGPTQRRGIGLDNTRARLRQLYGDQAQLTIANGAPAGAVVRIVLPYHAVPDEAAPEAAPGAAPESAPGPAIKTVIEAAAGPASKTAPEAANKATTEPASTAAPGPASQAVPEAAGEATSAVPAIGAPP